MSKLDTGIKLVKNVSRYQIGKGCINQFLELKNKYALNKDDSVIYCIDSYFKDDDYINNTLAINHSDIILNINSESEPTTKLINEYVESIKQHDGNFPVMVVGFGGGVALDVAKAISNLLNNAGKAEDYQGWDLLKNPGVFKVGIPTISGTGSEATRTCVMTNTDSGLKLGMNSDHTVFDFIFMDPDLSKTVPRDQYFYTGMDAYIHCMESISGSYRNPIGDALSRESMQLCREVFLSDDMQSELNREKLMVASYMGGCAIATSYVGVVHPFSAGLSVALGSHHCIANCTIMRGMEEFYPKFYNEFWSMAEAQSISIPKNVCVGLNDDKFQSLYDSTIMHEKPLTNALGDNFNKVLTFEKVIEVFKSL